MSPSPTEKSELRRRLRQARSRQPENRRRRAQVQANRLLKRFIRRGKRIAVYWPVGSEMRLDGFIRAARQRGAKLYLPYIRPRTLRLWFTPYPDDGTRAERPRGRGSLKIPQFAGRKIHAGHLHAMLLPLVGIDRRGYRLGQGGGYYDASLGAARRGLQPKKIGIGFACQLIDSLPAEAHDIRADYFVCERGITRFRSAGAQKKAA